MPSNIPGVDQMGEEYAGAMLADLKKRRKAEVPQKQRPSLPSGWMWNDSDEPVPKAFQKVLDDLGKITTQKRPEFPDAKESAVEAFRDVAHIAFNVACRLCGVDVEGRSSEVSWEATKSMSEMLAQRIEAGWLDQELSRELKLKKYHEAVATAQALAKELGLKEEEVS